MTKLQTGDSAPDFTLFDHTGKAFTLSEIIGKQNALLVFNIGFIWPHCTNHMAQLRDEYEKFHVLNSEVLVMVPNGLRMIDRYVTANNTPYPVLSDKGSKVAGQYFQVKQFFKVGTPTVILVDTSGKIQYAHYAGSVIEEPNNDEPLRILRKMMPDGSDSK